MEEAIEFLSKVNALAMIIAEEVGRELKSVRAEKIYKGEEKEKVLLGAAIDLGISTDYDLVEEGELEKIKRLVEKFGLIADCTCIDANEGTVVLRITVRPKESISWDKIKA